MNRVQLAEIRAKKEADKALLKDALRPFAKKVSCSLARKPGKYKFYLFACINTTADAGDVRAAAKGPFPYSKVTVKGVDSPPRLGRREVRVTVYVPEEPVSHE